MEVGNKTYAIYDRWYYRTSRRQRYDARRMRTSGEGIVEHPNQIPIEKIVDNTINDMENVKSDPSHSHAEVFKAWMIPDVSVKCIKSSS